MANFLTHIRQLSIWFILKSYTCICDVKLANLWILWQLFIQFSTIQTHRVRHYDCKINNNKTKKQKKIIILLLDYKISLIYTIYHILFVCTLVIPKTNKTFLTLKVSIAENLMNFLISYQCGFLIIVKFQFQMWGQIRICREKADLKILSDMFSDRRNDSLTKSLISTEMSTIHQHRKKCFWRKIPNSNNVFYGMNNACI